MPHEVKVSKDKINNYIHEQIAKRRYYAPATPEIRTLKRLCDITEGEVLDGYEVITCFFVRPITDEPIFHMQLLMSICEILVPNHGDAFFASMTALHGENLLTHKNFNLASEHAFDFLRLRDAGLLTQDYIDLITDPKTRKSALDSCTSSQAGTVQAEHNKTKEINYFKAYGVDVDETQRAYEFILINMPADIKNTANVDRVHIHPFMVSLAVIIEALVQTEPALLTQKIFDCIIHSDVITTQAMAIGYLSYEKLLSKDTLVRCIECKTIESLMDMFHSFIPLDDQLFAQFCTPENFQDIIEEGMHIIRPYITLLRTGLLTPENKQALKDRLKEPNGKWMICALVELEARHLLTQENFDALKDSLHPKTKSQDILVENRKYIQARQIVPANFWKMSSLWQKNSVLDTEKPKDIISPESASFPEHPANLVEETDTPDAIASEASSMLYATYGHL